MIEPNNRIDTQLRCGQFSSIIVPMKWTDNDITRIARELKTCHGTLYRDVTDDCVRFICDYVHLNLTDPQLQRFEAGLGPASRDTLRRAIAIYQSI